jgi:putative ABC transport system permease protein
MKLQKSFKHALNMVLHAKIRSWLTILGIVIGVAAVISIVSMGEALEQDMSSQLGELGGDLLTLTAGASKASGFGGGRMKEGGGTTSASASEEEIVLDKTDVQVLKGISNIKLIDTQLKGSADIYYVGEKGLVSITGVDPATWSQITTVGVKEGRMLGPSDANVIVVGGKIADGYFTKNLGVNIINICTSL